MSNNPVTSINAKKRGTTRFLTGSTPSTCSASNSSRILRAPRSAVIAVPATPAITIASTNGANSRIDASTKNPPSRSIAPNNTKKFAACNPGAPYPNAIVLMIIGNQHNRNANKNCDTNSPPYGYGGRRADTIVFPVKIIMSPTSSSKFFAGRKTRSAAPRTKTLLLLTPCRALGPEGYATPPRRLKREPSPLPTQFGQKQHVDPLSALQVAGSQNPLGGEPEGLRERSRGRVLGCRGDLDALEAERVESPVDEERY